MEVLGHRASVAVKLLSEIKALVLPNDTAAMMFSYMKVRGGSGIPHEVLDSASASVIAPLSCYEVIKQGMATDPESMMLSFKGGSLGDSVHKDVYLVADVVVSNSDMGLKPVDLTALIKSDELLVPERYCVPIARIKRWRSLSTAFVDLAGELVLRDKYVYKFGFNDDLPGGLSGLTFKEDCFDLDRASRLLSEMDGISFYMDLDSYGDEQMGLVVTVEVTPAVREKVAGKRFAWEGIHNAWRASLSKQDRNQVNVDPVAEYGDAALVYSAVLHDVLLPCEA